MKAGQMDDEHDFTVIRLLRKRERLTLKQLAQRAGLTYSTVALIEANKSAPSFGTLRAIAGALRVSVSNLLAYAEHHHVQIRHATTFAIDPSMTSPTPIEEARMGKFRNVKVQGPIYKTHHAGGLRVAYLDS